MSDIPVELDRRVRESAAREGLLDVSWALADSPVGDLLLASTPRGVCRIGFDPDVDAALRQLAASFGGRVLAATGPLEALRRELEQYFEGSRRAFDVAVDLGKATPFQTDALAELRRVPYGSTATYAELAATLGSPRGARAVGGAMNRNPIPIVLPCHRVVGSTGDLTGYAGGLDRKRKLLSLEGVAVGEDGRLSG
ncbi:MAG: methylated-DNA--[protein]-cysteine S-methyltransferase [Gaiellales bacterium]